MTLEGKRVRTVIFDMDCVVIHSEYLYDLADTELLRRRGKIFEREKVISQIVGKEFSEGTQLLKDVFGLQDDIPILVKERREILENLYATKLQFIECFPEFHTALMKLGIATCIATASADDILITVENLLGISRFFGDNIYKISDVGNKSKPSPAIFVHAAQQMSTPLDECVVIEDSPNGIRAAKNAAIRCVAITTTHEKEKLSEADVIVNTFSDIDLSNFSN